VGLIIGDGTTPSRFLSAFAVRRVHTIALSCDTSPTRNPDAKWGLPDDTAEERRIAMAGNLIETRTNAHVGKRDLTG